LYSKCPKTCLRAVVISNIFPGLYPGPPIYKGEREQDTERGQEGKRKERTRGKWARERSYGKSYPIPFRKVGAYGNY
jgi:hypothetical protein